MDRLCQTCVSVTEVSGAGVMLMSSNHPRVSLSATTAVSTLIEELQFTLGEGPSVDAYNLAHPIAEPDPAGIVGHWPAFAPPVIEAGARAIFSFPLTVGSIRVGALSLYRDRPGMLSEEQRAWALVVAAVAARKVLAMQTKALPGELAADFVPLVERRDAVHQATGMVSIQLGVTVNQALTRLRAHAFANDRTLTELSEDIVARRVQFDAENRAPDLP
jgi:hypothetical protein